MSLPLLTDTAAATAARCPYCHKVWMQLEEKRIPYEIEKINMRCYGDKPASFMAKVREGTTEAPGFVFGCKDRGEPWNTRVPARPRFDPRFDVR